MDRWPSCFCLRHLKSGDASVPRLMGIVTMEDLLELLTRELAALAAGVLSARDREFEQHA